MLGEVKRAAPLADALAEEDEDEEETERDGDNGSLDCERKRFSVLCAMQRDWMRKKGRGEEAEKGWAEKVERARGTHCRS